MTAISAFLNEWFIQNQRELPWRASKDPYIIWLSEVILQQTRVDQGIAYFYKFNGHLYAAWQKPMNKKC